MANESVIYREVESPLAGAFPVSSHIQESNRAGVMAGPHVHNKIEILYCFSGKLAVRVNSEQFLFRAGDLVLINSNAIHSVDALEAEKNSYFVFQFQPELLYSAAPSSMELRYMLPFTLQNSATQKFFSEAELHDTVVPRIVEDLHREYTNRGFGCEMALRLGIQQLFLWILRRWNEQGITVALASGEDVRRLSAAFDYVWENYGQEITVAQMATLCKMSYPYFSRFFHRLTGQKFVQYLNFIRILHAKTLLSTSALPVTEIAFQVGFSSPSYFIEQFRREVGIPPHRYRRMVNGKVEEPGIVQDEKSVFVPERK